MCEIPGAGGQRVEPHTWKCKASLSNRTSVPAAKGWLCLGYLPAHGHPGAAGDTSTSRLRWDGGRSWFGRRRASCQHQGNVLAMDIAGENKGFKRSRRS